VLENRVLREYTNLSDGRWQQNEENYIMWSFVIWTLQQILVDQIKTEWGGTFSTNGGDEKCTQKCVRNPKRKMLLRRSTCRWENATTMCLEGTGWEDVDRLQLA
jgi:hypothetical protein